MEKAEKSQKHYVVENIIKIMKDKGLTITQFEERTSIPIAKWSKISNGKQLLNLDDFSIIANGLKMSEIDILTYPDKFAKSENANKQNRKILIEFEVDEDDLLALGISNKQIKIIEK